ncbi:putative membrane protein YiaA [Variovorax sp. SG517]|uniref:hypothetical protein n=1 Tax=Variovorax sp. SG517 TaxID=2587117 RepID=UPI00159DD62E|nr:hypothetical protein [Variovorax sp. SG517]NVM87645.1 putative membrane protein YiaA [Variovorax sp. SG517]
MNSQPSVTDAVGFGVFLAGLVYAPNVAEVVGPYIVIVLASIIGASFALKRREKTARLAALWYFLRVAGLAVLITVSLAGIGSSYYSSLTERVLITPVALVIGAIGDDWPKLLRAIVRFIFRAVDLARGNPPKDNKEETP